MASLSISAARWRGVAEFRPRLPTSHPPRWRSALRDKTINKIVCKRKQTRYHHKQRLEFQPHNQNHSPRTYLKWRRRSSKIHRCTHQYQFIAANMDRGVQRSVTCIIIDSDVSTTLKKLVNYMVLFWKDGGMKRRFAWLVLAVDFFRVQKKNRNINWLLNSAKLFFTFIQWKSEFWCMFVQKSNGLCFFFSSSLEMLCEKVTKKPDVNWRIPEIST